MRGVIAIAGSLAQRPGIGGHTWVFLQYLLGFQRLGWDVLFLDRLDAGMCADAAGRPCGFDESENRRYFLEVMRRFGLQDSFSLDVNRGEQVVGVPRHAVLERVKSAAVLINVMGFLNDEEILGAAPRRAFLDIDPGFGQMWQELGLCQMFQGHDSYVTIGSNIGRPECDIPTCGIDWITTPQPVVLEQWPEAPSPLPLFPKGSEKGGRGQETRAERGGRGQETRAQRPLPLSQKERGNLDTGGERPEGGEKGVGYLLPERPEGEKGVGNLLPERPEGCLAQKVPDPFFAALPERPEGCLAQKVPDPFFAAFFGAFTSIVSWRGPFGPIEYKGQTYGLRVHAFRKFLELPRRSGRTFELALDIDPSETTDLARLAENGWSLVDPRTVAGDPWTYQSYIQNSWAEFMVAKELYVKARSGWISDRSLCYLASGKPVLAQDTHLKHLYPTSEGLLTFSTLDEAVAGVEELTRNYERHARAAREIAVEYFDSDKVLTRLLSDLGVG